MAFQRYNTVYAIFLHLYFIDETLLSLEEYILIFQMDLDEF
jgi:hypothetical protein